MTRPLPTPPNVRAHTAILDEATTKTSSPANDAMTHHSSEHPPQHSTWQSLKSLPTGIWAVSISNFLIAIAVTMAFSVSPFFLTGNLNFSKSQLSILEGFSEAIAQISKLFSGILSDMFRRQKPLMILGLILSTISKPLFIIADGFWLVFTSKVIERVSNGVIATPRDAYVATHAPQNRRGSSFGLMMSFKTAGCVVGSFIIGGLMLWTENYRMLLWIGLIPGILSIMIAWKFMSEHQPVDGTPATGDQASSSKTLIKWKDIKGLNFEFWSILFVSTLFMMARFSDGLLILRLSELGAPKFVCSSAIGIFNFISAICCLPVGHLSERINLNVMMFFSFLALLLSNLCFTFDHQLWLGILGTLLWGAQRGTSQILFTTVIARVAPKDIMGTAIGMFYIVTGLAAFGAGLFAGHIADIELKYTFMYGCTMTGLSMIALYVRALIINKKKLGIES